MTGTEFWLPIFWASIIAVAVILYVVLDGFDLGLGILFPFFPDEADRDQMMNSVAPFWDGNETWLVLGAGGLWAAFPLAFAIIFPAVYLPLIVMLLALIFRGVAFEYRWVAKPKHRAWDLAFAFGSIVATAAQGLVLGGLLQGIVVRNGEFGGGTFDWLTPFSVLCSAALLVGYALIGAAWLVMKTDGRVEEKSRALARMLLIATAVFIVVVSVWTPFAFPRIGERWFSMPNFAYLSPVPIATLAVIYGCWQGLAARKPIQPFLCAVLLFIIAFVGLVVSNVPYLVPPTITLWEAAAHPKSQTFMLVGVLVLFPIIIGYTVFNYWVFRGKVKAGEGYH
ncbi:MAG TPA: cytochrome d ubiquinol oxidase subunit II [Casimicrobiaceae bacterium]|nr:cytochrome d ubiquinol oxidase subunit II [Casimicrobiaceae bacterium]